MPQENALTKESPLSTVDWAKRLQAIAQTGLTYAKDTYDIARYRSVAQIASEMIVACSKGVSTPQLLHIFDREVGYATPKTDLSATRGAASRCSSVVHTP